MKYESVVFEGEKPSGLVVSLTAEEGKFLATLLGKQSENLLNEAGLKGSQGVFLGLYMGFDKLFNQGLSSFEDK